MAQDTTNHELPSSEDYALMSLLATIDEFGIEQFEDTYPVADLDREGVATFLHWQKVLPTMHNQKHQGDCTNESCACLRCHHDDLLERVRSARK